MTEQDINKERLELALEAAGLELWENDLVAGDVIRKPIKIFEELGYSEEETSFYVNDMFTIVHPDDIPVVKAAIDEHLSCVTAQYRCEFRLRAKSGAWVWYANYGKVMDLDGKNKGQRFIGVTFNIDDRKRKEDELELINRKLTEQNALLEDMNAMLQSLATSDSLTGVANRRKLMEMGASEVQRAMRFNQSLSLLIVDIDLFKRVNDTWGHMTGDLVICAVAEACVQCVRSNIDIVGRIGGEEFAIILPQTDYAIASRLAERLCSAVAARQIAISDSVMLSCTISIGMATLSPFCSSFKQLLIDADQALYLAKDAGRNCVRGKCL
ncbi:diguanylate cyclase [Sulfuriferula sp. AH1]|uniref:sensor domain-containing diguanylate cyclase n=1 Tax=Sulfuriferula sp. AH1 TaxID=1985873 RepID=UPI000B3B5AED|nr:sensor domain-containing diguanylate cyclase [Sulfuriferula sp. AH1]ARU32208.1 diguanylate cyclase [Sulfuriferula sp. AH1]